MNNEAHTKLMAAKDKLSELKKQRGDLDNLIAKAYKDVEVKQANYDSLQERGVIVSAHAIERFQQRIMDIPKAAVIKSILTKKLLKRHAFHGDGQYKIANIPHAYCVIRDYTVVTCVSHFNIDKMFEHARKYIHYKIDCYVEQALGNEVTIMTQHQFIKTLYH